MNLAQLICGQCATIRNISADKQLRLRLLDMGLTRGTPIQLLNIAPLGDPLEFKVRGYHLSLRKSEASLIEVELQQ